MSKTIYPKVSLVGAGPGDPELLTMKGLKALQSADVVLYDALVNEELLKEAPESAIRVFVGKRAGNHRFSQEEINSMIVDYAFNYGHVVRLKGGDPFVFGRGHEELSYVASFDIEVALVPGISSCIALPELQKVPLTRRGLNESFWVLTATTKNGALSADIEIAARSSATLVILMGLRKLPEISRIYATHGKGVTPVMVIQNGSLPHERHAIGTIDTIEEEVAKQGLGTPAIIVIGEVVSLHPELNYALVERQYLKNNK